jgi:hypothetical protein
MAITLTSEQEATVRQDASKTGFASAEEYLASRLESVHAEDRLWSENREQWEAQINEGLDQIAHGAVLTPEEAAAQREEWKREFLTKRNAA